MDSCYVSYINLYTKKGDSHFRTEYGMLNASVHQYISIPIENLPSTTVSSSSNPVAWPENWEIVAASPRAIVWTALSHLHFPFNLHFRDYIHLQRHAGLIQARPTLFLSSSHMVLIIVTNKGRVCFHLQFFKSHQKVVQHRTLQTAAQHMCSVTFCTTLYFLCKWPLINMHNQLSIKGKEKAVQLCVYRNGTLN